MDIIKPPADIEFSEILSTLKFVNELGDEGKGVLVFHCDHIQCSVVLYKLERAILLLNEED